MMTVPPLPPFNDLRPTEQLVWDELASAASSGRRAISVSASAPSGSEVRGSFLRWILLEAIPAVKLPFSYVELGGITVTDNLQLSGAKLEIHVRFVGCCFLGEIDLNDATIAGLDFSGGNAKRIHADRLTVAGLLQLRAGGLSATGPFAVDEHVRLNGAKIRGNLNMRGCLLRGQAAQGQSSVPLFADGLEVDGNVFLSDGFCSTGEVRLNGCKIHRNLDCTGATLTNMDGYSISAAGAEIDGSVYLCQPKQEWTTYLQRRPFVSIGTVRFEGADIKGDFDCTDGQFTAAPFSRGTAPSNRDRLYAIRADGLKVGANVQLRSEDAQLVVRGAISLTNASVGHDFFLESGRFEFPGEELLVADGIKVSGTTFLRGANINGIFRFVQADLRGGFEASGITFDNTQRCLNWFGDDNASWAQLDGGPACGIYASLAEVGQRFIWENNVKSSIEPQATKFWLYLPGAKTNTLSDDQESWAQLDRFEVNGCRYGAIDGLAARDWRVGQLDRQYAILHERNGVWVAIMAIWRALTRKWLGAPLRSAALEEAVGRFKPQPYIQLAKAYRNAAYEKTANDVLVHYQRNKTRYSDFGVLRQIGRWFLDLFLLYGFSPFRPVVFLLAWLLLSAIVFQLAYLDGKLLPAKDPLPSISSLSQARPRFNALLYSIDTLIPIVDFNQKKSWAVESIGDVSQVSTPARRSLDWWQTVRAYWDGFIGLWSAVPRRGAAFFLFFNTFFGWLMTSLFVAGIGGLLRSGREDG